MTSHQKQIGVRATYMRGGTSKGVFFEPTDLPAEIRNDGPGQDAAGGDRKAPTYAQAGLRSTARCLPASSGKQVSAGDIDLCARIFSMGRLHHAMTGTGAVAIAVAAAIRGTVVSRLLGTGNRHEVRFGHPSGALTVGAVATESDGEWKVEKATMRRAQLRSPLCVAISTTG
jgi:2-methylaconitate isomerase